MSRLPNFFIIGAQKAGTTTLYEYFRQHPNIFMSKPKEPHFFSNNRRYVKGLEYYSDFFVDCKDEKMIGDASTTYSSYTDLKKTIQRIHKFNPNSKLVYILRNPISRAYSSYWWMIRFQKETFGFEEALQQEEHRINTDPELKDAWSYKRNGLYFYVIEQYLKYFPKENLKIILLDDLKSSAIKTCNDVFEFLDLKKFDITELEDDELNKAKIPTNKFIQRCINNPNLIRYVVSNILQHTVGTNNKDTLYNYIAKKTLKSLDYPPMKESTFEYLAKYFEMDIKQLEEFLGRNLTHWVNSKEKLCGLSK